MQVNYGNGLHNTEAVGINVNLAYPVEALPALQPGALAKAVEANLTALRHAPYEAAEGLLTYRRDELKIRTDPMMSQLAKSQKLDALLVGVATDVQKVMDDSNSRRATIMQKLSAMLYPSTDTNQQMLFEMRMQAAWQRATRAIEHGATPYAVIQQAGEQGDRILMAVLLRELPAYVSAAYSTPAEARRERENLTDSITQVVRTLLTPVERDAASIQDEIGTGMTQLVTTIRMIQQDLQSQRGPALHSGGGYKASMLIGWSKAYTFTLDDKTLANLSNLESQDMARLK